MEVVVGGGSGVIPWLLDPYNQPGYGYEGEREPEELWGAEMADGETLRRRPVGLAPLGAGAQSSSCAAFPSQQNAGEPGAPLPNARAPMSTKRKVSPSRRVYKKSHSAADLFEVAASSRIVERELSAGADVEPALEEAKKKSYKERRFHRLFRSVPLTETLICRYSCAYVGDKGLLMQGHLYVSADWFCFHSNVFGLEKIIEIPVRTVVGVTKERTAKIFPNAVGVRVESGKQSLFCSLLSRDNTYQLLLNLWERNRSDSLNNSQSLNQILQKEVIAAAVCEEADALEEDSADSLSSLPVTESSSSQNMDSYPLAVRSRLSARDSREREKSAGKSGSGLSLRSALLWYFGLPKILMVLIFCVVLLVFLFLCAAALTYRLICIHDSRWPRTPSFGQHASYNYAGGGESGVWLARSSEKVHSALDSTLLLLGRVKEQLESLRKEVSHQKSS